MQSMLHRRWTHQVHLELLVCRAGQIFRSRQLLQKSLVSAYCGNMVHILGSKHFFVEQVANDVLSFFKTIFDTRVYSNNHTYTWKDCLLPWMYCCLYRLCCHTTVSWRRHWRKLSQLAFGTRGVRFFSSRWGSWALGHMPFRLSS